MIIKPNKFSIAISLFIFGIGLACLVSFCIATKLYMLSSVLAILLIIITLRCDFGELRTLELNQHGCKIKFLFYKQFFEWKELKTIRMQKFSLELHGGGVMGMKGIVFSTTENFRVSETLPILTYLDFCLNPFCFFIVLFKPQKKNDTSFYEVEEEPFMKLLEEYGVEVQK